MALEDRHAREHGPDAVLIPLDAEQAMLALMAFRHSEEGAREAKRPSRRPLEPPPAR
jgi:hypothetical protein